MHVCSTTVSSTLISLILDEFKKLNLIKIPDKHYIKKVKWSRYRPSVAQRVGRGIALLFLDRGTRRGWAVSSTPQPHFTPGKDPVPILQETRWGTRASLYGRKISSPPGFNPKPSTRISVAIPTELPDPQTNIIYSIINTTILWYYSLDTWWQYRI